MSYLTITFFARKSKVLRGDRSNNSKETRIEALRRFSQICLLNNTEQNMYVRDFLRTHSASPAQKLHATAHSNYENDINAFLK